MLKLENLAGHFVKGNEFYKLQQTAFDQFSGCRIY